MMKKITTFWIILLALPALAGVGVAFAADVDPGSVLLLLPQATVDGSGIYLSDIAQGDGESSVPRRRLAAAPALGQTITLSRVQLNALLAKETPDLIPVSWAGAEKVRISRRVRNLKESEIREWLTMALQRDYVQDKGELEIRLSRNWTPLTVPDEPLTVGIRELPTLGVGANFIVRFELRTAQETVGEWQWPVQAKIWRMVWVVRQAAGRGQPLIETATAQERRDLLAIREPCWEGDVTSADHELASYLPAGSPLYARAVQLRPVVHRGQTVDARLEDGALSISLKVEVLEDGAPGQMVRVRNPRSQRGFQGKVQDDHTILIIL